MLATIASATLLGVVGTAVTVEVHVSSGLPGFTVVGLPDTSCREARDRVRAALLSSGLRWPQQRVTVNLAPTGVRKSGAGLDLAIAIGLLVPTSRSRPRSARDVGFVGELGLDGAIRPVGGALPLVDALATEVVVVAPASAVEAQLVGRHVVRAAASLGELLASLCGDEPWPSLPSPLDLPPLPDPPDLADVRGQDLARRALEVAAAGGHHLLMMGSPGSGKTMLAQRLVGLLPDLALADALETTRVHSAVGVALPPGRPGAATAVPGPPPRGLGGGHGRRRRPPARARGDLHRSQRRALPRRDGRVPRRRARRAAPAARGRRGAGGAGRCPGDAAGPVPAGRRP